MTRARIWVLALGASAGACASRPQVQPPPKDNASPFADAGTGSQYLVGTTITLDGTGSYDPDGTITSYQWSTAGWSASGATAAFTLSHVGMYTFGLTVTDNDGASSSSTVTDYAEAPALAADAGPDQSATWAHEVQLSGSYMVENDIAATVEWQMMSAPPGSSTSLAGASTLTPSFLADATGNYMLRLTVTTAYASAYDDVTVTVSAPPLHSLGYQVVDAEYSTTLDRFAAVADQPASVHVIDPETGADTGIALTSSPIAISVEPGGTRAAVAQTGKVTVVDLQTASVIATYNVGIDIADLVFGGDNRVHCLTNPTSGTVPIYTLDLGTGASSSSSGQGYGQEPSAKLRPDQHGLYVRSAGGYTHFDATASPVTFVRDDRGILPHPDGNLGFTRDGLTLVDASGDLLAATDSASNDLTYERTLAIPPSTIAELYSASDSVNGTLAVGRVLWNPMYQVIGEQVAEYSDQTFAPLETLTLPPSGGFPSFVAFRSNGSRLYILSLTGALFAIDP